ncbi:MAG: hypothetical protein F6K17_31420 [Okeania sp. SIO3C4]|nr:hypothetical protein [Okeania sp. SIO3C4]
MISRPDKSANKKLPPSTTFSSSSSFFPPDSVLLTPDIKSGSIGAIQHSKVKVHIVGANGIRPYSLYDDERIILLRSQRI